MSNFTKLLIAAGKVGKITATSLWRATGQTMKQNKERMAQAQSREVIWIFKILRFLNN